MATPWATLCGLPSCSNKATSDCAGCKVQGYCSKEHQHDDWKAHKVKCRRTSKAKERGGRRGRGGKARWSGEPGRITGRRRRGAISVTELARPGPRMRLGAGNPGTPGWRGKGMMGLWRSWRGVLRGVPRNCGNGHGGRVRRDGGGGGGSEGGEGGRQGRGQ